LQCKETERIKNASVRINHVQLVSPGMTFPTAFAAPVVAGMMFADAVRPSRHFFDEGASKTCYV
jgi:hypothetical protein